MYNDFYDEIRNKLFQQLNTNSNITALIDIDDNSDYMIMNDEIVNSEWGNTKSTINYYRQSQDDFSCYGDVTFSCNCRAFTMSKSEDIANTIKRELHEKTIDDFIFTVTLYSYIRLNKYL